MGAQPQGLGMFGVQGLVFDVEEGAGAWFCGSAKEGLLSTDPKGGAGLFDVMPGSDPFVGVFAAGDGDAKSDGGFDLFEIEFDPAVFSQI